MNNIVVLLGIVITVATGLPVLMQMLKNHPKGLIILFFAEMWERFSYYGMRGLLIFYLTQHFLFDDSTASSTYGSYTSLVYLLPLLGGIIADRWLGTRKAIAFGALLLVAGHGLMAYEGRTATQTLTYAGQSYDISAEGRGDLRQVAIVIDGERHAFGPAEGGGLAIEGLPAGSAVPATLAPGTYTLDEPVRDQNGLNGFYLAVSLIIMGVAFLKANISSIVGQLYPSGDPRRDSGFTLYYYGINLGAFWAAVLCGYLGQTVGWAWGFGLAGIGMAAGWVVFVLGKPLLQGKGEPPNPQRLAEPFVGPINREWLIYGLGILAIPVVWFMVQRNALVGTVLGLATIAAFIAIVAIIVMGAKTWTARKHMILATVLIGGAVVFWTLFEQAGTSLNLFTDRNVDLLLTNQAVQALGMWFGTPAQMAAAGNPGGLWIDTTVTASQTQSFNAGFILIFAPVFAALWAGLGRKGRDPNPVLKFALGLLQVGLGFLVVVWAVNAGLVNDAFKVPLFMLGLLYLLHTTGELCLSPVGLSQITKLSLPSVVSFMMAVWFLSSSIAQFVGGKIAAALGTETVGGQVLDPSGALQTSLGGFTQMGWAGVICGAVFLVLSFIIGRWGEGSDAADEPPHPDARIEDGAADIDLSTGERTT